MVSSRHGARAEEGNRYDGTPFDWTMISPGPLAVGAVSQTSVYGFTSSGSSTVSADVEVYSGTGTTWTVIGGPAWVVWPGGNGLAADGS